MKINFFFIYIYNKQRERYIYKAVQVEKWGDYLQNDEEEASLSYMEGSNTIQLL